MAAIHTLVFTLSGTSTRESTSGLRGTTRDGSREVCTSTVTSNSITKANCTRRAESEVTKQHTFMLSTSQRLFTSLSTGVFEAKTTCTGWVTGCTTSAVAAVGTAVKFLLTNYFTPVDSVLSGLLCLSVEHLGPFVTCGLDGSLLTRTCELNRLSTRRALTIMTKGLTLVFPTGQQATTTTVTHRERVQTRSTTTFRERHVCVATSTGLRICWNTFTGLARTSMTHPFTRVVAAVQCLSTRRFARVSYGGFFRLLINKSNTRTTGAKAILFPTETALFLFDWTRFTGSIVTLALTSMVLTGKLLPTDFLTGSSLGIRFLHTASELVLETTAWTGLAFSHRTTWGT